MSFWTDVSNGLKLIASYANGQLAYSLNRLSMKMRNLLLPSSALFFIVPYISIRLQAGSLLFQVC
jgi:hypothetical protein